MQKKSVPSFEDLKKRILEYNPRASVKLIKKAYDFAKKVHEGQFRASGEPYWSHPIHVASILVDLKSATYTICAGLLHDVVEDSDVTIEDIKNEFNREIAMIVEGLTNIDKINFDNLEHYKAENIRKILLATTKDARIIFVKLADRLHNMRTLSHFRDEKRRRIAKETLEIYAPIAHKLGMWNIKGELEDLSLRYLEPEVYSLLRTKINEKREEREASAKKLIRQIKDALKEHNIKAKVYGRAKYFYSIYKKMVKKNVDFNEIYDLVGIRIITEDIPSCYSALGVIHEHWKPLPKRFKDYIATPKANGYQSLHTAVIGRHGKILEVQIRTATMHRVAEDGIAAHWMYHGSEKDKRFDKKISWLKQLLEWRSTSRDAKEFIDQLKFDLFDKEIVVFTPKGDPIILPEHSSVIDFAYAVHTNIGNRTSKAKVNNKVVPLDSELKPGDIVEIITKKNARPSRAWLSHVKTSKARSKIRSELGIIAEVDRKKKESKKSDASLLDKIEVEGKKHGPLKLSKCCSPKLNDPIVAYYTKDKKITIHKADCPNIHALGDTKQVRVSWKTVDKIRTMKVNTTDRVGILVDVLNVISSRGVWITNVYTDTSKENALMTIKFKDADKKTIKKMISDLRAMEDVIAVNMVN